MLSVSERHLVVERLENSCVKDGLITSWNTERWILDFLRNMTGLPTSGMFASTFSYFSFSWNAVILFTLILSCLETSFFLNINCVMATALFGKAA